MPCLEIYREKIVSCNFSPSPFKLKRGILPIYLFIYYLSPFYSNLVKNTQNLQS